MSNAGTFGSEFLLEKERYEAEFAGLLAQSFEPRTLYQFLIYLPFHIAFETAESLCISRESQSVLFFFSDIEVSVGLVLDVGALSGSGPATTRRTRVEMVFVTSDVHAHEHQFVAAFDECLEALNTVIIAFMLVKRDFRLYRVTRAMFQAACITRIVHLPAWQVERSLLVLHTQVPYVAPALSASELPEFQRNIQIIAAKLNPFVDVLELQFAALRQLRAGDFREAILSALSAAEAMLGALFIELLRIDGLPAQDAYRRRASTSLMRVLREELPNRLPGAWEPNEPSSVVGAWYSSAYRLRNTVVHEGYRPSRIETDEALAAVRALARYINDQIETAPSRYSSLRNFIILEPQSK